MPSTRIVMGQDAIVHPPRRAVVTIGVFDGVHLAHQRLIRLTVALAKRLKGTSTVITFAPAPQTVVEPVHAQPALMPLEARLECFRTLGVDRVWVIPFTRQFARMTAAQFVHRMLLARLEARALVLGERFLFGRNRQGNMDVLKALGSARGMRVVSVRPIRRDGVPVSSSRIRRLISIGQLASARRLLGRSPTLYGVVIRGTGRGRRLGFPTANLRVTSEVLPPQGVYAVRLHDTQRDRTWRGVMNLGVRPTFGPGPLVCEAHLFGFSGTLLGRSVAVSLLARLRGERCFPSLHALGRQIRHDIARARRLFARLA